MKIYAINGSPRKNGNTVTMMNHFIEGAKSVTDVDLEFINLYDLDYKGCRSCFLCQSLNDKLFGECRYKDDITELLHNVPKADALILGSPIYIHTLTSGMHAFWERLMYQYIDFTGERLTNAPKALPTAMIYTMNVTKDVLENEYEPILSDIESFTERIFKVKPVRICAYDTYQYSDYSKYRAGMWDEKKKAEVRETIFPKDCQNAYEEGKKMALAFLK